MSRIAQSFISIYFTVLITACASNQPPKGPNSALATQTELRARQSDDNFCRTVFSMAIVIATSRHLLPQSREELEQDMKAEYPGYENTIASMIDEAYKQKPLRTIGETANAANQLKNKWISRFPVCADAPTLLQA